MRITPCDFAFKMCDDDKLNFQLNQKGNGKGKGKGKEKKRQNPYVQYSKKFWQ